MLNNKLTTVRPSWANFAIVDSIFAPPIAWYHDATNARRELARHADAGREYSLILAAEVPLSR